MLDNMPRGTICIEDIEIGMTRHLRKVVTDRDIEMFAEVSTDHNPVHLDDDYANDTIFEGRIAHGMLTAGLISAVIGEQLPGHGTVYLGQSLKFLAPVRPAIWSQLKWKWSTSIWAAAASSWTPIAPLMAKKSWQARPPS